MFFGVLHLLPEPSCKAETNCLRGDREARATPVLPLGLADPLPASRSAHARPSATKARSAVALLAEGRSRSKTSRGAAVPICFERERAALAVGAGAGGAKAATWHASRLLAPDGKRAPAWLRTPVHDDVKDLSESSSREGGMDYLEVNG